MGNKNRLQFPGSRITGLKGEHVGLRQIETAGIGFAGIKHSLTETAIEIDQPLRIISGMCFKKLVLGQIQAKLR